MIEFEPGYYLIMAIMSMAICMAIIPIMMKLSPYIGMIDKPDNRKVHISAIPRSGGIGIVIGILIPLLIWLDVTRFSISIITGCTILLIFGAWDDACSIRPAYKFLGQFLAAITVVYYGDIFVFHFPFIGTENVTQYIGKPFTVIAIVGMINAMNLSDGLDGLAGGEALISLLAIAYLSFQFDGSVALAVSAITAGGIFGFLRFNSHPARIFMGDAGSQTLGFVLAVLAVYLTQNVNALISPIVALLILGLPVIDSIVVFYLRARRGDSLVVAARDHLHHRLLKLGFYHYESVMIIYTVQLVLVISAVLLPYENDILLLGIYLITFSSVFLTLNYAEGHNWKAHSYRDGVVDSITNRLSKYNRFSNIPYRVLVSGISFFIVAASVMSYNVPFDVGLSSLILLILLIFVISFRWLGDNAYRMVCFSTIGFSVYLLSSYPPDWLLEEVNLVYLFFLIMSIAAIITVKLAKTDNFRITPLDYLVVIMVLVVSMAPDMGAGTSSLIWIVVQMIILFYACEMLIQNMNNQFNSFTGAAGLSLALIAFRGLL